MADSLDDLRRTVRTCPIIDNHAHNLLRPQQLKTANFLGATSEAEGEALQDHTKALPHFRAARQLRQLYGLPQDTDWHTLVKTRQTLLATDAEGLIRQCLEGTHTILIDDGLDGTFEKYSWHDQFVASPCKRIVRIEAVAAEILRLLHEQGRLPVSVDIADEEACSVAWATFIAEFEAAIASSLADPEVVGFKSVICYRTGLDVDVGRDQEVTEAGLSSFRRHFLPHATHTNFRVQSKGMNDALVISACKLIEADHKNTGTSKPLQFHTGLGDNDIDLIDSNPACLQDLIKHFPAVPIVLLHSSYPYTREAGYLATVYKNVYLDLGEVFPQVSRNGQENIIRQALEITPTSKLLWSTDGHHHPETYYLANLQGRVAIEKVLCEYVIKEDLTVAEAMQAAKDILFLNSNILYNLDLVLPPPGNQDMPVRSRPSTRGADSNQSRPGTRSGSIINGLTRSNVSSNAEPSNDLATLTQRYRSIAKQMSLQYVFIQWLDYNAQIRSRWLPIAQFDKLIANGAGRIAISRGNMGTTQNDHMSSVCDPVGSIYVEPDLKSFRLMQANGSIKNTATVMARFTDIEGHGLPSCPRAILQSLVSAFKQDYDVHILVGFEIEITFCRRNADSTGTPFTPLDTVHNWGTLHDQQYTTSTPLMLSIASALASIGIEVEQVHSEAGAGQYEFVLPPLPPMEAVDTLIQAKQCIQQIAASHGLRATCHPMPFPGIGTAAHAHISLNSETADIAKLEQSFIAAVLEHLPAICAITMPQKVSYNRVVDDSWTGGTWVAWGTNNRETPLRKVAEGRWEVRCLDGFANMYLAMATILAVGLSGVRAGLELNVRDCVVNPTRLSEEGKRNLGIGERMPRSLGEALEALGRDGVLRQAVGVEMVGNWSRLKEAEQQMLGEMGEEESRVWFIERY